MISTKTFLKMLSASDDEIDKIISRMSEKNLKELVKLMFSFIKNDKR